ncbi:MAG: hypothetical protein MJ151_01885 [Lachnospiraceae bacterium]|nr:hypothetical protein [Lachnospiraceae bacterium]
MIIIPKNKIYNSYIIESPDIEKACDTIEDFITDFSFDRAMIKEKSHPDYFVIERDSGKQAVSIEKIREKLIDKVSTIPTMATRKVFVVKVDTILSKEIQNALLKTLEEPPIYVSIFIVIKNKDLLLDTIKSRCVYVRDDDTKNTIDEVKDKEYIDELVKVIVNLKYNDMYDIIDVSKSLSNIKSNDEYKKMLIYMLYFARDAFYYTKPYDQKKLLLNEKEVDIMSMAESYSFEALGMLIKSLDDNLTCVDSNVDKQLLIEDILMRTKKELK